jgi:hypothetical protein
MGVPLAALIFDRSMHGLNRLRENFDSPMKVPKGRLKITQDIVLGLLG